MVSNDLVMPLVLRRRERADQPAATNVGSLLLTVRRIAIFAIILLAYLYYRSAGDAQLASIGLLVLRRDRAARAGLLRRPGLAARHRAPARSPA